MSFPPITGASTYRYMTTNILTGEIMGDNLPIVPQTLSRNINSVGTFTGSLSLDTGSPAENRAYIAAVENEQAVLWVFQDGAPIWCGVIWDWPHQTVLPPPQLPISASTMESVFQHRQISNTLTYADMDIFDIFRDLGSYAVGKTPNGQIAGMQFGTGKAGVDASIQYVNTDLALVSDAWSDLVAGYDFEYSIRPAVSQGGNYYMSLDLGYPELGLPLGVGNLAFDMPGNLLDYQFVRTGSSSANYVVATASSSGGTVQLNLNDDFETGTAPWTAFGVATIAQSSVWSSSGDYSIEFTGNGTGQAGIQSELIPVTAGQQYNISCTVYSPQGWTSSNTQLQMVWYDNAGYSSDSVGGGQPVPAATATQLTFTATAPAGATQCYARVNMAGSPPGTVHMYADQVVFALAVTSNTNWESQPPHGVDYVTLDAGYPLLETSATLSTAIVTAQSQIDAYADGLLPSLTGTQLAPVLILGNGQYPAVKDIVLGSYCYFNATSSLHPANDDGTPGLQIIGRITGYTLYPPTSQQAESTQFQLGAIAYIA